MKIFCKQTTLRLNFLVELLKMTKEHCYLQKFEPFWPVKIYTTCFSSPHWYLYIVIIGVSWSVKSYLKYNYHINCMQNNLSKFLVVKEVTQKLGDDSLKMVIFIECLSGYNSYLDVVLFAFCSLKTMCLITYTFCVLSECEK